MKKGVVLLVDSGAKVYQFEFGRLLFQSYPQYMPVIGFEVGLQIFSVGLWHRRFEVLLRRKSRNRDE